MSIDACEDLAVPDLDTLSDDRVEVKGLIDVNGLRQCKVHQRL